MNLRLRAFDLLLKTLVVAIMTLIVPPAYSATEDSDVIEDFRQPVSDIVEKFLPIDVDKPYRERRQTNGFMFSLGYENVEMFNYLSIVDFTNYYDEMFGSSEMQIYNMQLSYKYNFSLGSLALTGGIGYGTLSSDISGQLRTLSITKYTASASYIMDALFPEPYAAPYVTAGINQFNIQEKDATQSASTGIEMAPFYTFGVLVQLNWLDDNVSRRSLREYGLENTYLDLSVSQFGQSMDSSDPNTETETTFGAGLRLEF